MQQQEQDDWRGASEAEIKSYYREEFPDYISEMPSWISPAAPEEFGIALTSAYPVVQYDQKSKNRIKERDFIRRSSLTEEGPRFSDWDELIEFFSDPVRNDPISGQLKPRQGLIDPENLDQGTKLPVSDSVYYSLQNHNRFWVLAFDLDAKSLALEDYRRDSDKRDNRTILQECGVRKKRPAGYEYEFEHVEAAVQQAFELSNWLENNLEFEDTRVFYSGQGAHIYALDEDPYHQYTLQSRQFIASYIRDELEIPIDTQVTFDSSRVLRLPYSLHTDVCRIVKPVESPDIDVLDSSYRPDFLSGVVE